MIKRKYWIVIQSVPPLRALRRRGGKVTIATSIISYRSFLPDPAAVMAHAVEAAAAEYLDFNEDEILITSINRI